MNKKEKGLTIILSPYGENSPSDKIGQRIDFFNVLEGAHVATEAPTAMSYDDALEEGGVALFSYIPYPFWGETEEGGEPAPMMRMFGGAIMTSSTENNVTIFRQEVRLEEDGGYTPLTALEPVTGRTSAYKVRDYNISNNRCYRYVMYLSDDVDPSAMVEGFVEVRWPGWSLTELHATDSSMKTYTASPEDVWLFNLDVDTGEQTQNTVTQEQQTLGRFPRFSYGKLNYITGNVSCLLGSQFRPAEYTQDTSVFKGSVKRVSGGYEEKLPFSKPLSSNDRIDMLTAWRKVVSSGNPKLLKDRKGQAFLVAITDSSNKPMDNVAIQPDRISFSWTQIGDTKGLKIIENLS